MINSGYESSNGHIIAEIDYRECAHIAGLEKINADLIAAAPDLFTAIEEILEAETALDAAAFAASDPNDELINEHAAYEWAIRNARRALSRARGEH